MQQAIIKQNNGTQNPFEHYVSSDGSRKYCRGKERTQSPPSLAASVRTVFEHNSQTQTRLTGSLLALVDPHTVKSNEMLDLHYLPLIIEFGVLLATT